LAVNNSDKTIYQIKETDLLSISIKEGNIYACRDTRKVYEDISATSRVLLNITMLDTENDRLYNITPAEMNYYYVWETNEIWIYNKGWVLKVGTSTSNTVAYYNDNGLNSVSSQFIDTNGLLKDGSVVVRDVNRIIKGKLYIDPLTSKLVITSYMGGEIDLLPNGTTSDLGALTIDRSGNMLFNGKLETLQEMYVKLNGSEYKVYNEGNLTPEGLGINSNYILEKLKDLPTPLGLDVDKVDGKDASAFSLIGHTHTTSDITDIQSYTNGLIKTAIMSGANTGLTISYNSSTTGYNFKANDFVVTLIGGVTGSGTVTDLGNTIINTEVDPNMHVHDITKMTGWQDHLNYEATQLANATSSKLDSSEIVSIATQDKVLRLNDNAKLPADITGNSATTSKLYSPVTISFTDGVTGSLISDWSTNSSVSLTVDPTKHDHAGYVKDSDIGTKVPPFDSVSKTVPIANIPSLLYYSMRYEGTFDASTGGYPTSVGSVSLDKGMFFVASTKGTVNGIVYNIGDIALYNGDSSWIRILASVATVNGRVGDVTVTLDELSGINTSQIGVTVAPLDANKKVPTINLPDSVLGNLQFQSTFNPANGVPSASPSKGQYWVAQGQGTINSQEYLTGDWIIYDGTKWVYLDNSGCVQSVNGQQGVATITATNIGAQPVDSSLTAISGITSGIVSKTAIGTAVGREIASSGIGLSVQNSNGVSGNPTIVSNATDSNTASTVVSRDSSGNFSAGIITADIKGNASSATKISDAVKVATDSNIYASSGTSETLTGFSSSTTIACTTTDDSTTITVPSSSTISPNAVVSAATSEIPANSHVSSIASSGTSIVITVPSYMTTAITGNGTSATAIFTTQSYIPFSVGSSITVTGSVPTTYNGTFTVTACTVSSVSWASTETTAATTQGTISFNIKAGSSVQTTFSNNIEALIIDGVTLSLNDRVLVKDQDSVGNIQTSPTGIYNGIYYLSTLGTASVPWVLTRSSDASSISDIKDSIVFVDQGTANATKIFRNFTKSTDTLGSSSIVWSEIVNMYYLDSVLGNIQSVLDTINGEVK
jgi:hypothetical protein